MIRLRLAGPALLLMCLSAAGCLGDPPPQPEGAPAGGTAVPASLHLSNCTGFQASTWPIPAALSPARPPQGWEGEPTHALFLLGFECGRLALGPFERPVRLLVEAHTDAVVPAGCARGARTQDLVLHAAWLDDAEVAAFLAQAYGLPAAAAAFEAGTVGQGGALLRTWRWAAPGHASSDLRVPDAGSQLPDFWANRLLWPRGEGLGTLTLSFDRTRASAGDLQAPLQGEGTMAEPMLMAGLPGGRFAGPTQTFPRMEADGAFSLFRDRACQSREPPGGPLG